MTESLDEAWDRLERQGATWDDRHRLPSRHWGPPILLDLVVAARSSSLGRLYPFTSHAWLRFRSQPRGLPILPVMIGLTPDARYWVVRVRDEVLTDGPLEEMLKMDNAAEAVAQAAQLVA
ncbi:hypothetical protein [Streptodolium elevatio]